MWLMNNFRLKISCVCTSFSLTLVLPLLPVWWECFFFAKVFFAKIVSHFISIYTWCHWNVLCLVNELHRKNIEWERESKRSTHVRESQQTKLFILHKNSRKNNFLCDEANALRFTLRKSVCFKCSPSIFQQVFLLENLL